MAKNLTYYVKRSGKTQKELADIVGVATSTFNDWMKAKRYPRIDRIEMLADYFGILKSDLIEDKGDLFEELKGKTGIAVDIVIRLGADAEFCEAVEMLNALDSAQLSSVKGMLRSFLK